MPCPTPVRRPTARPADPPHPHGGIPRGAVAGALCVVLALTGCSADAASSSVAAQGSVAGGGALLDASTVHTVEITVEPAALAAALETYLDSEEKVWVTATVTLDGTVLHDVGLRLKGNSSLREVGPDTDPATLPWLVSLDRSVGGQSYAGLTSFVIRSSSTTSALNEAVALDLLAMTGLASEESAPARLSVNGGDASLRLLVENLDERWDDAAFTSDGILYKAEATGDYSYRGDDPAAYEEVFDQETTDASGEQDLAPLIELLRFVDEADDAAFAAELADHLDVDAFATYLAFEDLVDNVDDIAGPGNNSYLRYDAQSDVFTVVAWDHNLAFGVRNAPGDLGGLAPGGSEGFAPGDLAGGAPAGPPGEAPDRLTDDGTAPAGGRDVGGGLGGNVLTERFLADPGFAASYDDAIARLTADLYDSGAAAEALAARLVVLQDQAADLVDSRTLAAEAATISAHWG